MNRKSCMYNELLCLISVAICVVLSGCELTGYSTELLYNDQISSVYIEMFDNRTFERGVEYELTDALAKRIEASTPYKVVSSRDRADTILTGYVDTAGFSTLTVERETGRPMEQEFAVSAVVNWKDISSGKMLIDNQRISAAATYSEWQSQGSSYATALVANKLAKRIVELMENPW